MGSLRLHARSLLGLAAVALALVVATVAAGCGGSETAGEPQRLAAGELELHAPASWSARRLPVVCRNYGPGVLVSNLDSESFERPDLPPEACTNAWEIGDAPPDFVLVDLSLARALPMLERPADSRFPPTLGSLTPAEPADVRGVPVDCRCTYRFGQLWLDGQSYGLRVWVGDDASESDLRSLDEVLASIRPPRP